MNYKDFNYKDSNHNASKFVYVTSPTSPASPMLFAIAIILLLLVMPRCTVAQSNNEIKISWTDIEKLVNNHPRIGAEKQRYKAAKEKINAASAISNPSVDVSVLNEKQGDTQSKAIEWELAITIPLHWITNRNARLNVAKHEAAAVNAEAEELRLNVLLQLRILFWNLVYEQERIIVINELQSQINLLKTTIKKRVEKGEARLVEEKRIAIEAEKIAGELEEAKISKLAYRSKLEIWLGFSKHKHLFAVANFVELTNPISDELARKKALSHPAINAAKSKVQSFEAEVIVERRARVPSFSLELFTAIAQEKNAYGIGLSIDVPIWNWNNGNIESSKHMAAYEQKIFEAQKLELETAAVEARAKCQAGVSLANRYNKSIIPLAEFVANSIKRTYQLGENSILDIIDSRRTLLEAKKQYLNTLIQTQIDCSILSSITGGYFYDTK